MPGRTSSRHRQETVGLVAHPGSFGGIMRGGGAREAGSDGVQVGPSVPLGRVTPSDRVPREWSPNLGGAEGAEP